MTSKTCHSIRQEREGGERERERWLLLAIDGLWWMGWFKLVISQWEGEYFSFTTLRSPQHHFKDLFCHSQLLVIIGSIFSQDFVAMTLLFDLYCTFALRLNSKRLQQNHVKFSTENHDIFTTHGSRKKCITKFPNFDKAPNTLDFWSRPLYSTLSWRLNSTMWLKHENYK